MSFFKRLSWNSKTREEKLAIKLLAPVTLIILSLTCITGYFSFILKNGGQTTGIITHSMVNEDDDCFVFRYEYQVDNQLYTGDNIKGFTYAGHKGCYQGSETASIFLYGRLAMGKKVMVYYSINNPSFSTLNPAIGLVFYVPLILTVAFFSALIVIYVKGLSS
ncbi:DUF3592 domain-containing protein [Fulvivirga ligni]|uniref:DUF3592 domain-containing protein n=1 Tax=Fulvivirga ligni TaxID=2904246 RepID=UPI001F2E1958|nr:hypothetical protein [Fulvivirga ligni]UII21704.1 hypothetical protein LVD16_00435 [Fulvivirga ligni]